ncbi:MAG: hypothetical protein AAF806_05805 [Bacteroidota bacterium]
MPRRRRKYRPPQQELEKAVPFFAKATAKEELPTVVQTIKEPIKQQSAIEQTKTQVAQLLYAAKYTIKNSQPESAATNQQRALELYNRMIEADVSDIEKIKTQLERFCECLEGSEFICGQRIMRSYGQSNRVINLGHVFNQSSEFKRVEILLKAVIQNCGLSARQQLSASQKEQSNSAEAWANYIFTLLDLLPDQPYLTRETPIHFTTTITEEEKKGREFFRVLFQLLRRLFILHS